MIAHDTPSIGRPKTALITLGRMPVSLALARALHAVGFRVIVAEPFKDHLCRWSKAATKSVRTPAPNDDPEGYLKTLLDVVARDGVDLVVPSSEETLHAAGLVGRLPEGVGFFGEARARRLDLHHKERFIRIAEGYGLPVPATAREGTREADALVAAGETVTKPVHGCSGGGLAFQARGEAPAPPPTGIAPRIVQERVRGREVSVFLICRAGQVAARVAYVPRLLSGTVAVVFERVDDAPAALRWAEAFAAKRRHTGFLAFDMIEDASGEAYAIECNPRVTSGAHFFAPADLGRVLVDPDASPIAPTGPRLQQQFWPALTETQARTGKAGFASALRAILAAKDVTRRAGDAAPFWMMTWASRAILMRTIFKGESFGEAATRDIAWRDEL